MTRATVHNTIVTTSRNRIIQRVATVVIGDDPENVDRWIKETLIAAQDAGMSAPILHAITYMQRGPGEVLITAIINATP